MPTIFLFYPCHDMPRQAHRQHIRSTHGILIKIRKMYFVRLTDILENITITLHHYILSYHHLYSYCPQPRHWCCIHRCLYWCLTSDAITINKRVVYCIDWNLSMALRDELRRTSNQTHREICRSGSIWKMHFIIAFGCNEKLKDGKFPQALNFNFTNV